MKKKIVLEADKFLTEYSGDVWDFKKGLPTGIIDKKYTGLGATYCEIYAKRNSIIVSPTRSLARSKYENAVEDKNQNNINKDYSFFYLGGGFEKFKTELFADFLNNENHKKIFVVSDSFYKTLKFGGEKIYDEFALVVDEIDSIQQDTSYRSCLEDVVDYFWKFKNKAVVTATYIDFNDKKFLPSKDFPYYEVEIIDYKKPELDFYEVSAPLIGTINLIHELFLKDNNKKMFIALNCVSDINKIIKTLKENENFEIEDFGVFCSERSETNIYPNVQKGELVNGILNKKINFATSSYFVGIDIEEPVHLIVWDSSFKCV